MPPTNLVSSSAGAPAPRLDSLRASAAAIVHRIAGIANLTVVLPDGTTMPAKGDTLATIRLHDWSAVRALLTRDQSALFSSFLDRGFDIEPKDGDDAAGLLASFKLIDEQTRDRRWLSAALSSSRYFWQQNTGTRRSNLAVHYSVPPAFWLSFLKNDYPIYSHYLFEPDETWEAWEAACARKLQFALDVCGVTPGQRVLNIGEGWGGFLTYGGRRGVRVTGITLNDESYQAATTKMAAEGLGGSCEVVKTDFYHFAPGVQFDAITNMGVTEHLTDYDGLMARYGMLLKPGGCVYSDFVGARHDSHFRAFVQRHVYPGAAAVYLPKLVAAATRSSDMEVVATFDDRLSYKTRRASRGRETSRPRATRSSATSATGSTAGSGPTCGCASTASARTALA